MIETISQTGTTGKAVLLVANVAAVFLGFHLRDQLLPTAAASFATVRNSSERPVTSVALPFSFDEVTNYFSGAVGRPPDERRENYAFFGGGTTAEGLFNITIIQQDAAILVRFRVIDDYGMNFIRKFFEAPFFQPVETEQLYSLLYMGEGIHCANLPCFDVLFEYDMRPEVTTVAIFFSPPVRIAK